MIVFLMAITILTMLSAGCMIFIKKKIITIYRGGMMIVLSGVYFMLFFYVAHLMRESFK